MLGAVLARACGARALARRLGARTGVATFWVIGLATPVAIYALDFWEHSLGLALMLWGVVLLFDVAEERAGAWRGRGGRSAVRRRRDDADRSARLPSVVTVVACTCRRDASRARSHAVQSLGIAVALAERQSRSC